MNSDTIQLIGLAVLILAEQYAIAPWQFPVFARIWDFLANLFANLSWWLGYASMRARANYYTAVEQSAS